MAATASGVAGCPLPADTPADTKVQSKAEGPNSPVSTKWRAIPSAIGDRHVFPVQTNRTHCGDCVVKSHYFPCGPSRPRPASMPPGIEPVLSTRINSWSQAGGCNLPSDPLALPTGRRMQLRYHDSKLHCNTADVTVCTRSRVIGLDRRWQIWFRIDASTGSP